MPNDDPNWPKNRKVATLPGIRADAVTVLARTLDKAQQGKILSVVVSIEWQDSTTELDWSSMKNSTLCYHAVTMQEQVQREMFTRE